MALAAFSWARVSPRVSRQHGSRKSTRATPLCPRRPRPDPNQGQWDPEALFRMDAARKRVAPPRRASQRRADSSVSQPDRQRGAVGSAGALSPRTNRDLGARRCAPTSSARTPPPSKASARAGLLSTGWSADLNVTNVPSYSPVEYQRVSGSTLRLRLRPTTAQRRARRAGSPRRCTRSAGRQSRDIVVAYEGADSLSIDASGNLVIRQSRHHHRDAPDGDRARRGRRAAG